MLFARINGTSYDAFPPKEHDLKWNHGQNKTLVKLSKIEAFANRN